MANHLLMLPVITVNNIRSPKYLKSRGDSNGLPCQWALMYYGFLPTSLVYVKNISDADAATLSAYPDVYAWPDNLDQAIDPQDNVDAFFETLHIPTNWLNPSSTYRQLLRNVAGIFQFNRRYQAISQNDPLFAGSINLDSRFRDLTTAQRDWINQTVASFGYNIPINQNMTLRNLLKLSGDAWTQPFILGGVEF